ncbi:major facilitator superfamily domain, general substrate transporter [Echria macrotheca]|uniref:Major facilitator superfamily domain, general substrate transporter n=1 Tax=Echria macrotheca TaxID=438768 RepID=A0AAJ0B8I8_9PEZI|nr:major facilitator superfamily domain, general substrate transporter [Echria macrotheca]
MFLAVKYAKKKIRENKEKKAQSNDATQQQVTTPSSELPTATPKNPTHQTDEPPTSRPGSPNTPPPAEHHPNHVETPEEAAEKKRRRIYRYKIVFGLAFPFMLQALDTTIIASALPYIATDFNEIAQLNWIITAFNLTAAAFLPFWAQTADIWGRHPTMQTAIVVMAVGSALCTGAPTSAFGVLLLGRALQGVGAAGVNICVRTILADRVDLAEYAKNWTVFSLLAAVGFSVGPVAGGYLTQVNWRWCFGINLPVAAVAIVLVVVLLRKELLGPQPLPELEETESGRKRLRGTETRRGRFFLRLSTVDFGGQVLFLFGVGLVVLALTWGGGVYAWDSAAVVAPLVVGFVLTAAWLLYEYEMVPGRIMARVFPIQRAMMPWNLLVQRDIGLLFYINFSIGVAMFAVMYFMDLYFALVLGHSASDAGLALLYFLPGLGAGAFSATFFTNVWPRQTQPALMLATLCAATGITVLAFATYDQNLSLIYGMMALTGYGTGLSFNPGSLHALAHFPTLTAPIQCLVSFSNPFGGTVGLTLMSTVFNNRSGDGNADPKTGIKWAFIAIMPILWASVLATTFLGNVWILPKSEGGHDVARGGAFFWSLLTRKKLERIKMLRQDPLEVEKRRGREQGAVLEPAERQEV